MIPLVKVGLPSPKVLMPRLNETLYSGMIGEGEAVYKFERQFLSFLGCDFGIAMSSGTSALHAALVLAEVGHGNEVITTSMTAEPTNLAILHAGATPIFADVDQFSGNISPESIKSKITPKTKAIIVVHYAGIPVRLKEIKQIAKEYNLKLIEDCAHALGAKYGDKSVGVESDFAIFSFQAIKHMTLVDGGFLIVNNMSLIEKAKKFRWFGMKKGESRETLDINSLGYKYNMNNVTATIGLVQLESISQRIGKHIENGMFFDQNIESIKGIDIVQFDKDARPSYWLYTLLSDDTNDIIHKMHSIGVQASKLHKPNHLHSIFDSSNIQLPNLELYYKRMVHIPCGWWLKEDTREKIVNELSRG